MVKHKHAHDKSEESSDETKDSTVDIKKDLGDIKGSLGKVVKAVKKPKYLDKELKKYFSKEHKRRDSRSSVHNDSSKTSTNNTSDVTNNKTTVVHNTTTIIKNIMRTATSPQDMREKIRKFDRESPHPNANAKIIKKALKDKKIVKKMRRLKAVNKKLSKKVDLLLTRDLKSHKSSSQTKSDVLTMISNTKVSSEKIMIYRSAFQKLSSQKRSHRHSKTLPKTIRNLE